MKMRVNVLGVVLLVLGLVALFIFLPLEPQTRALIFHCPVGCTINVAGDVINCVCGR